MNGFNNEGLSQVSELCQEERAYRDNINTNNLCKFYIKALDDPLSVILPNDLVVIGADSGAGKSEIALNIARKNAEAGKRIALFYLEGGHMEAIARMKWKDICHKYYRGGYYRQLDLDYGKWRTNQLNDPLVKEIESTVDEEYKAISENLLIYRIKADFTCDHLDKALTEITCPNDHWPAKGNAMKCEVDLILIDHLQYFALNAGETEIESITNIMRKCKEITDYYKVPVVIISHLRKKTKDRGLPDQADFYGSSNIPKISSTAITISPLFGTENFSKGLYPTVFRIVKSRTGIPPSIGIRTNFDITTRAYQDHYLIHRINGMTGQISKEPIYENELPKWARKDKLVP